MTGRALTAAAPPRRPPLLPSGAVPLAAYLLAFLVAPVALLVLYSAWTPGFFTVVRRFTVSNYIRVLTESTYLLLFARTLAVGLATAAVLVVCGFLMAYAITFKLPRWGPRVLVIVTATLLASYLVRIYAWKTILGNQGLVNTALLRLGLIDAPLEFLLYGYPAIFVTLAYVYLPFAVLLVYAGLQNIDPRVLEASRDMGAGRLATLRRVTLPLARPALRVAFAVSFILAAADYVTPSLVGGLHGQMVGRVIASQFGGGANYPLGAALSVLLVAAMVAVLVALDLAGRAWARLGRASRPLGRPARRTPHPGGLLGRLVDRFPISEVATVGLLLFLLTPLGVVILFSLNAAAVPAPPLTGLTLDWYGAVVGSSEFRAVLATSLTVMAAAVALAVLLGVPAALALARRSFRLQQVLGAAVLGPVAVPGVVVGVALLSAFIFLGVRLGRGTTVVAHTLLVLPFVVLVVRGRLLDMDRRIEEAARDLGAGPRRVFRTITLPLLLPSLAGAVLLAGAISLDDVIVTNFVSGSSPTLPVWILGLMRRTFTPAVNAAAVLVLAGSLTLIALAAATLRLNRARGLSRVLTGDR